MSNKRRLSRGAKAAMRAQASIRTQTAKRAQATTTRRPKQPPESAEGLLANNPRYIALHEAGHAVAAVVLGINLEFVDVQRRELQGGTSFGLTRTPPVAVDQLYGKRDETMDHLIQVLSGPFAEAQVNPMGIDHSGNDMDVQSVQRLLANVFCRARDLGSGKKGIMPEDVAPFKEETDAMFDEAMTKTEKFIREWFPAIEEVAELLMQRFRLTGREVAEIVQRHAEAAKGTEANQDGEESEVAESVMN